MDDLPLGAKILKSLIAPAKHSDGPTLYLICSVDDQKRCTIFEQLPDGKSLEWAEERPQGVQQAEGDDLPVEEEERGKFLMPSVKPIIEGTAIWLPKVEFAR